MSHFHKLYTIYIFVFAVTIFTIGCNDLKDTDAKNEKQKLISEQIIEHEKEQVLKRAEQMLAENPITVTDTSCVRSAGI